jgi:hypothetical protein
LPAGNHLLESSVSETFEAPLQHCEVVFELGDPVDNGMLGAATALLRGMFGAPTHAEKIALAPLDLRAEVLVLGRQIKATLCDASSRAPTSVTSRTMQSTLESRLLK